MDKVNAKSYTLRDDQGFWLGQVVLTNDGAFMSITDWGNFNFAWRHFGKGDFREFLSEVGQDYFAGKMYNGISYVANGRKIEAACKRFAEKILPALQATLKIELEKEVNNG